MSDDFCLTGTNFLVIGTRATCDQGASTSQCGAHWSGGLLLTEIQRRAILRSLSERQNTLRERWRQGERGEDVTVELEAVEEVLTWIL